MKINRCFLIFSLLFTLCSQSFADDSSSSEADGQGVFRMREYRPNYFASGDPDTKIQFSFRFQLLENYAFNLGFTQTLFWQLGKEESNPFSELNFNPELFYRFEFDKTGWMEGIDVGYGHKSNGEKGQESRSYENIYVELNSIADLGGLLSRFSVRFRYFFSLDSPNLDLVEFYGPLLLKVYLSDIANLLMSEELYVEWYNGGKFSNDFSKGSTRVSLRIKIFDDYSAPKIFMQYFNGYGENLRKYDVREETYRIGLSIGGK